MNIMCSTYIGNNYLKAPVIKWSGSKRSQARQILDCFPRYITTYYEPFVGGGSVFMALLQSDIQVERFVLSDINSDLIALWKAIKETPQMLADSYQRLWDCLKGSDDDKRRKTRFYNDVRRRFNECHSPGDFLFLMRTCVNGMPRYNAKGEFNTSFHITRDGIRPETMGKLLLRCSGLLQERDVTFTACSYETIQPQAEDFVYLDPPYAVTRGMYYGTIDYDAFFQWMQTLPCGYILSFDGKCPEKDYTYAVPGHLYDRHIYLRSGNSSFRRIVNNTADSLVYESLYIKYNG